MIFLAAIVLSLLVFSRAETTLNPQQLLTAHLNYRATVNPPASNMQPMVRHADFYACSISFEIAIYMYMHRLVLLTPNAFSFVS